MKWGVTKVKHPNKGHTPNKGQKPMYQGVRYSERPLYYYCVLATVTPRTVPKLAPAVDICTCVFQSDSPRIYPPHDTCMEADRSRLQWLPWCWRKIHLHCLQAICNR